MGRTGAALRAAKAQTVRYTFTKEQLEARDRALIKEYRENTQKLQEQEVMKQVREEFAEREKDFKEKTTAFYKDLEAEFFTADANENFQAYMQYLLALSCRILIEQFGWPAITDHASRTRRFASALVEELYKLIEDPDQNIQSYAAETARLYGVEFRRE